MAFSLSRGNAKLFAALILEDVNSYAQERRSEFEAFKAANSDTKTWTDTIKSTEQLHTDEVDN